MDPNQARLLPRFRPVGVVEQRARSRAQAAVLLDELAGDQHATLPSMPGEAGGDPDALRGLPAIGRSVRGVIRGTDPEGEAVRRVSRAESVRERTELAA